MNSTRQGKGESVGPVRFLNLRSIDAQTSPGLLVSFLFNCLYNACQSSIPVHVEVEMLYNPLSTVPSAPHHGLIMNSLSIRTHRGLLECLRQRRMRMTRPPHILTTRSILKRQHAFRNHLSRIRAHNMNPQYPIRLGVRNKFDHSLRLQSRLCSAIRTERETACLVFHALLLQLRFILAYPCDFRMSVHDAGDSVVVDVAVAFADVLDARDGFFFCFVGEHGPEGAVANDTDVGESGAVLFVYYEAAFVVDFEADIFETEACGVGAPADGDKNDVCVKLDDGINIVLSNAYTRTE
jgi:hypothetical protein